MPSATTNPKQQPADQPYRGYRFALPTRAADPHRRRARSRCRPRASAVQNPSSSAGNSNFPLLSVRPVSAGVIRLSRREDAHLGIGERLAVGGCELDRDLMPGEQVDESAGPGMNTEQSTRASDRIIPNALYPDRCPHPSLPRLRARVREGVRLPDVSGTATVVIKAARNAWRRPGNRTLCCRHHFPMRRRVPDEDNGFRRRRGRRACRGPARGGRGFGRHRGRGGRARRPARRDPRTRSDAVDRRRAL